MAQVYGWANKILRVNLSTGKISTEATLPKYQNFIGGAGIGYKVLFDEVPQGTKALSAENKIILGVGPLTGLGAPLSGRTNIATLSPMSKYSLVADGHMGGNFGVTLKFAGYDAIIVEGASSRPVWLKIVNDKVTLEDASGVWGKGTVETSYQLTKAMGNKEACIGCIGPAGENLVPQSVFINGLVHSGGVAGAVFGFKQLKAIGIVGTQPVRLPLGKTIVNKENYGETLDWLGLNRYMLSDILGTNNQMVVPKVPQSWAEFSDSNSRWTGNKGVTWGASDPLVTFEETEPGPTGINKVGYRTQKAIFDLTAVAEKRTVKMDGCHSCPIRCQSQLRVPELENYQKGIGTWGISTCIGYINPNSIMNAANSAATNYSKNPELMLIARTLGSRLSDDYGIWSNYGQLGKDFAYCYKYKIFEKVLPADEYKSIPWDLLEKGDPAFLVDVYARLAKVKDPKGKFGELGNGAAYIYENWNLGDAYADDKATASCASVKFGFPKHHHTDETNQVGGLLNIMFNRDPNSHSHMNFFGDKLPYSINKDIAEEIWGVGALDPFYRWTPMNQNKAKFAKWSIDRNMLHDSITLCNWTWPMSVSPLKSRNYRGDTALEAKFFTLGTGIDKTEAELDLDAERITTLHRACTVLELGTMDMRNEHDILAPWAYHATPDLPAFTEGSKNMDHDDFQLALTMLYKEYGWDEKTGAPTRACLTKLGMSDVADKLAKAGLLPA